MSALTPAEIAEYFRHINPEFGDLDDDQVRVQQESAYLYIQNNRKHQDTVPEYGQTSSRSLSLSHSHESESLHLSRANSHLDLDEAIARSLQLGDGLDNVYISEHSAVAIDNAGSTHAETHTSILGASQRTSEDDIDPDEMSYEELQSLGEAVGTESKGLSADLLARLPSFKYSNRSGFFSRRKKEIEECVICCSEFKNGAMLTPLPCAHQYHSECISPWLQLNKHCPVCKKEVRDD